MTTQYQTGRSSGVGGSFLAFLIALVLGAIIVIVFLHNATAGLSGRLASLITGRTTTFDTSVPAVVEKIQRLSRLETVVYSLDTVVEGSKSSTVLPTSSPATASSSLSTASPSVASTWRS